MSIKSLLSQEKFKQTSKFAWHTLNNTHEVIKIEDNVSIIKLKENQELDKILYKGIINTEVENILNSI